MTARLSTWTSRASLAAAALAASGCFSGKATLSGSVQLDEALKGRVEPTAVLYVVARPVDGANPPPLAVKRIPQPISFPYRFTLTDADVMIPGTPFKGRVSVSARIAQSGSAVPALAGDLESSAAPLRVDLELRTSAVDIVLDRVRN